MDRKNQLAVLTPKEAFHIYTVSNKFLGWEIEDEITLPLDIDEEKDEEDPYTTYRKNMAIHKNKEIDTIMVVTRDPDISYVRVTDKDGNEHGTNGTHHDDVSLHYIQDEDGFDENLTFKMYSYEEELLYTE